MKIPKEKERRTHDKRDINEHLKDKDKWKWKLLQVDINVDIF